MILTVSLNVPTGICSVSLGISNELPSYNAGIAISLDLSLLYKAPSVSTTKLVLPGATWKLSNDVHPKKALSSISSILSIAAFPIYIYYYTSNPVISLKVFSIAVAVIILITHHDNIIRLIKGKEHRFFTWRKKDDNQQ